jgi:16S rRNA (adenine1518-N6/adenine1519-N6)-dimethyltransferase
VSGPSSAGGSGEGGFQDLRERLDLLGFHPSKKLGQNFLVDRNLLLSIANELDLAGQQVLEIGAGPGGLTRELAAHADRVLAVEVDRRLQDFLQEEIQDWGEAGQRVRLLKNSALQGSALQPELAQALEEEGMEAGGYLCVSNLPYSISGPMLAALCVSERPPREILCLCQWEMGERIVAKPGGRDYGSLSALLQLAWQIRLVRRVGKDVFRPRPGVDSALVHFGERADSILAQPPKLRRDFSRFLQGIFAARRKQLRGGLTRLLSRPPEPDLEAAGLDLALLKRRPEAVASAELLAIFRATAIDCGAEGR